MKNKKNIFVVVAAAVFMFGFSVFGIIASDKEISVSERRPLAKFPQISAEKILTEALPVILKSIRLTNSLCVTDSER